MSPSFKCFGVGLYNLTLIFMVFILFLGFTVVSFFPTHSLLCLYSNRFTTTVSGSIKGGLFFTLPIDNVYYELFYDFRTIPKLHKGGFKSTILNYRLHYCNSVPQKYFTNPVILRKGVPILILGALSPKYVTT